MTRMERRRRRRRILRIKLATTAAVLALTTASIVALTGGAAETVPEPTPQPPALQAEPVLLTAEHDSTYQPVQMTTEPAQEPEPVEEEDENEKIEAALLEQGYLHEEIPLDFDLQCHLIAVCEEYGVPQNVALGVIQAESSFTATAANGSCYGYMQINSINSEWLSEKIGVTDLADPYQNIRSGVFILSDLYGKYGDWHKALICYNYGEGGAQEHVFSKGYTMAWAFAETRERLRMYEETRLSPLDLKDRLIAPFQNDMFAMVWGAFKKLYPDKDCEIYWEPQIRDEEDGKPVYGLTDFADDGSVAVFVKPSLEVADAVEVLAHELAHVAVGVEHDHDEVWQEAFDKIFEEYNRIGSQMFPDGEDSAMDDPDEK